MEKWRRKRTNRQTTERTAKTSANQSVRASNHQEKKLMRREIRRRKKRICSSIYERRRPLEILNAGRQPSPLPSPSHPGQLVSTTRAPSIRPEDNLVSPFPLLPSFIPFLVTFPILILNDYLLIMPNVTYSNTFVRRNKS